MSSLSQEIQENVQVARPDGIADSLIRVNGLSYRLPSNMSVVVNRSMKRSFANLDSYSQNGKIIVTWNTGSEFVSGLNSYLVFNVTLAGTATKVGSLASGSAINFIDSVTVNSVQGTEIDRCEGVNYYQRDIDRHTYSQDYINNIGSVMGYGSTEKGSSGALVPIVLTVGTEQTFCIPLSKLCGMCNTSTLIPAQLAGGCRFEIKLSTVQEAVEQTVDGEITGFSLTNVSMMLDTYQLADSIQKRLMQEAASNGLEFYYETYDRTRQDITTSSKANVTIRKSVARALSAHAKTRTIVADASETVRDSMASETNDVSSFFWRLGSLNFPNQRLTNMKEQYLYAQYAMNKTSQPFKNNSISYNDFAGTEGLVAVTLERSNVLKLSGLPVSNSRSLQVEIDYANPQSRNIDVYMRYLQLARVFVNNVLVKE